MNRRLATILFCAFVIAVICSYGVYRLTTNQILRVKGSKSRIVVAVRDLPTGTLIHDSDVSIAEWLGSPPKGAASEKKAVVGRGVVSTLYQGEPVLDTRLAAPGSGGGLGAIIRTGMRACAVKVDEVIGVAGFVIAGQRVDVLISGNAPGTNAADGPRVKTLLQNIEVLSAGTNIQRDAEGKPVQVQVVNLLVTPEQAQLLSLASTVTRIQLVLRNPLDTNVAKTSSAAMASLFSDGTAPKPVPVSRPIRMPAVEKPVPVHVFLVQVLNGSRRTEEKFAGTTTEQPQKQQQ